MANMATCTGMSSYLQPDWGWHLPWWRRSWCWCPWWTCLDPAASLSKTCHKQYPAMPGAACESASELIWCETIMIRMARVAVDVLNIHISSHHSQRFSNARWWRILFNCHDEMSQYLTLPVIFSFCRKMTTTQPKPFCLYEQFLTAPVAFSTRRRNLACASSFSQKKNHIIAPRHSNECPERSNQAPNDLLFAASSASLSANPGRYDCLSLEFHSLTGKMTNSWNRR